MPTTFHRLRLFFFFFVYIFTRANFVLNNAIVKSMDSEAYLSNLILALTLKSVANNRMIISIFHYIDQFEACISK